MKRIIFGILIVTLFAACGEPPGVGGGAQTYTVTYDGNTNSSGTVPSDSNSPYQNGATVTVLGNTGSLAKTGNAFVSWNTQPNGSGTNYAPGATFTINENITLYARWTTVPTFTVTYNGNSNNGGTVPTDGSSPYQSGATVTVLGNTGSLTRTGFIFAGWNTAANGSGTNYNAGATFNISANTILYARWTPVTCTVTFNSNGGTSVAPITGVAYGATITAPTPPTTTVGGVTKNRFRGWYTDNGTFQNAFNFSTPITANITLYADWGYKVGDTGPAGGIIFYVAIDGFDVQGYSGGSGATAYLNFATYKAHYLEAAPADEVGPEMDGRAKWGAYGISISGVTTLSSSSAAEASLIGNGRKDTYTIVSHLGTGETGRAAQLCANKSLNIFSDWFLPSLGELNQLYLNRAAVNSAGGSLGTSSLWSSSHYDNIFAWSQNFNYGYRFDDYKDNISNVRAVRAF